MHVDVRFDRPVAPLGRVGMQVLPACCTIGELEQFEVSALHNNEVIARGMITLNRRRRR